MPHVKLEIVANEYQQEELIALFDDLQATGFEQTDDKLIAYFSEDAFAESEINQILQGYRVAQSSVGEKNWNEEWEQNFQPVVVDDFVAVRAHFHPSISGVEHEIVITPKMSFGTGHHATTWMMMRQMRAIEFRGKSVFDFGTGTGILAILAEKLGAGSVSAIDVDDWSIENAMENFERNDCRKIDVQLSSNLPVKSFDVILANINRNVILDYLPHLVKILKKGGTVLFSGLLKADEQVIRQAAQLNGLGFETGEERQGWIALRFVNLR